MAIFICTQVFRTGKKLFGSHLHGPPSRTRGFWINWCSTESSKGTKLSGMKKQLSTWSRPLPWLPPQNQQNQDLQWILKTNYFDFPAQNSHSLLLSSSNGHWIWINYHSCMPVQSFAREKSFTNSRHNLVHTLQNFTFFQRTRQINKCVFDFQADFVMKRYRFSESKYCLEKSLSKFRFTNHLDSKSSSSTSSTWTLNML